MAQYRKKPVVIEAFQLPVSGVGLPVWAAVALATGELVPLADGGCEVRTLEDGSDGRAKHVGNPHDWVIRGVKGELYCCKPDIFEATYDVVTS